MKTVAGGELRGGCELLIEIHDRDVLLSHHFQRDRVSLDDDGVSLGVQGERFGLVDDRGGGGEDQLRLGRQRAQVRQMGAEQRLVSAFGNAAGLPGVEADIVEKNQAIRMVREDAFEIAVTYADGVGKMIVEPGA